MALSPDIFQPEHYFPVDQATKNLLHDYFLIWEVIDDENLARTYAEAVVHPEFSGRFITSSTGPERVLDIAKNRRNAFEGSRFIVNHDEIVRSITGEVRVPYIFVGRYRGDFLPQEAKGKYVQMHGVAYYEVKEGKLLGLRSERNEQEMFEQLGVVRPSGETTEF